MSRSSSSAAVRLGTPWIAPWRPRPTSPDRATPCSWLRGAPPWTCSPTTARGATPSPPRCGGCRGRKGGEDRPGGDGTGGAPMTTLSPGTAPPETPPTARPRRLHGVRASYSLVRDALHRPLTSYYLL